MKVLPIGGNIIVPISSRRRKTVSPVSTITYIIVIITTKCAVFFFFQVISRHVELQGKSYPLEQQQQVIAYNTMFE